MYRFIQPPACNGCMDLTPEQQHEIAEKLQVITDSFEPSMEQPVLDTFYITATYNKENPDFPINGDTVQMLLAPSEVGE